MDLVKGKGKKGLMVKTWERCRSFGGDSYNNKSSKSSETGHALVLKKSKSCPRAKEKGKKAGRIAPEGWFSVYVGAQKERFVIKTEYVNHPLFKVFLEEAESEYGYNSEGPLALPCDVESFVKALMEMDSDTNIIQKGCIFVRSASHASYSYHLPS